MHNFEQFPSPASVANELTLPEKQQKCVERGKARGSPCGMGMGGWTESSPCAAQLFMAVYSTSALSRSAHERLHAESSGRMRQLKIIIMGRNISEKK